MTVCRGYLVLLTRLANPEDPLSSGDLRYDLVVGDGTTTTPSFTDQSLESRVYRTRVTDFQRDGETLYTATFLDSTEATGEDITELGVVAVTDDGTEYFCNRERLAGTAAVESKSVQEVITLESALELRDDPDDA